MDGRVMTKDDVGRWGEDVAAEWLRRYKGFEVLDRNWRGTGGELDLVALDGPTLAAVEVKTRSGERFGHPAEAVDGRKIARLRRLTGQWLAERRVSFREIRVDVVAVRRHPDGTASVEHFPGVC